MGTLHAMKGNLRDRKGLPCMLSCGKRWSFISAISYSEAKWESLNSSQKVVGSSSVSEILLITWVKTLWEAGKEALSCHLRAERGNHWQIHSTVIKRKHSACQWASFQVPIQPFKTNIDTSQRMKGILRETKGLPCMPSHRKKMQFHTSNFT